MSRIQGVQDKWYKGVHYRSTLEADTAETLDLLGLPIRYEERTITLLEGFRCPYQKDKVRAITYTPDFLVGDIILECKGFATPEWKNKRKYVFKYLMENEPETIFYETHDSKKDVLKALDPHWSYLGMAVKVTSKGSKKKPSESKLFDSVAVAMEELNLRGRALGPIVRSLTGKTQYVYGYNWQLVKIHI